MTFTDEDLKRFKYALENIWAIKFKRKEIEAIIARLEAAEALEPYWKYYSPISPEDETQYNEKVEAHRKQAGK